MLCKNCDSTNIVKIGKVNNKQRYRCKTCGKTFIDNDNFANMRTQKHIIAIAMDLYFDGMSVRKIQRQIEYIFKVKVSQVAIYKWIIKYSTLVKEYVDTLQADLGDTWHVDETAIKVKGQQKWFWEIIDKKTRFMVAEHLSKSRKTEDSIKLFRDARNRAIKKPKLILSDGCFAYRKGFTKVFWDNQRSCQLIQNVGINGRRNQNIVERLHGTLKDMLRARRGMYQMDKTEAMLDGWLVYYNFLRPHSSLGNKTPAEVAGIKLDLSNRWESLIDLATKWKTGNKL
ncbi:MAG: IS6 family transposase [Methanobacterium sp.]|jgi:putative transposase